METNVSTSWLILPLAWIQINDFSFTVAISSLIPCLSVYFHYFILHGTLFSHPCESSICQVLHVVSVHAHIFLDQYSGSNWLSTMFKYVLNFSCDNRNKFVVIVDKMMKSHSPKTPEVTSARFQANRTTWLTSTEQVLYNVNRNTNAKSINRPTVC